MKTPLSIALAAIVALAATALPAQDRPTAGSASVPEIETIGSGERRIAPDRATVMIQIESRASSAAAAAAMNATAAQAVRDALRRMRADTAAATASYHVGPEFGPPRPADREEAPRVIGYIARTVVRARITQLDQLGPAMDAALAAGATGIEGLFFESSA
ncbi:MAG TPA: SIMPL domain-containing protein, partial [Gemmatimonadaceae bacterium]